MNYKNYIFDFGGVFIDIHYQKTIDSFRELGIDKFDEFYSQMSQTSIFDDFETGKFSSSRFINELLNYLPNRTSPNQVIHAWNAMLGDINLPNIEYLRELKNSGKNVVLLSNTNDIHIDLAFKRWEEQTSYTPKDLLDSIYLSHEIGLRKPHVEIFEFVIDKEGYNPEETIFIDDTQQHIEGAIKTGLLTQKINSNTFLKDYFS